VIIETPGKKMAQIINIYKAIQPVKIICFASLIKDRFAANYYPQADSFNRLNFSSALTQYHPN